MNNVLLVILLVVGFFVVRSLLAGPSLSPTEAAERVASGEAVLIDVREPDEWSGGVATPALLLSLSDLRGARERWKEILAAHGDKELLLYCRSGARSGAAVGILRQEGYRATNAGSYSGWRAAGLPVRQP